MEMPKVLKPVEGYLRHKLLYDGYIVSYPKCGRTWLNAILLHYVRRHYESISEPLIFEWAPSMVRYTWCRRFPNICFTHDISSPPMHHAEYTLHFDASRYLAKRSMLLVRDPRDVVVSYYHHAMKKVEKNNLSPDTTLSDFLRHEAYGIRSIATYYTLWAPVVQEHLNVSYCRYEDLQASTAETVRRLLQFLGVTSIDQEALEWAIEMNKFENLQRREANSKLSAGLDPDINKLRVRKGKVGGYREEMTAADIEYVELILHKYPDPLYGYLQTDSVSLRE